MKLQQRYGYHQASGSGAAPAVWCKPFPRRMRPGDNHLVSSSATMNARVTVSARRAAQTCEAEIKPDSGRARPGRVHPRR